MEISRRKVVALLAYLALGDQPQARDALAALLWPDYDQASARTNLRRDLSRLKRAMGAEHLEADRHQIKLVHGNDLFVDVAVFEAAVARVRRHHPAARRLCDNCATALSNAVSFYQEDFMGGFALPDSAPFEEWQFFQREGLRRKLAELLRRLIDWHVDHAEYTQAVEYGRRWVALDGLHEPAQRRLMQLYAWSGQRAAAIRQYQEAARLLEEELGEAPEEETVLLYESIRNRKLVAPNTRTGPKEPNVEARYEVLDLLAVGGHAEVYYGRDRTSGIDVVIKRLKPELLEREATYLQRFIREAEALSHLEHPNIVRMLAAYEEADQHNIVMEYVPGGNLRQLLERESPLPVEKAVVIALELADALGRAHHLSIIHRDLKPDNVLLAADGTPRLTDFGLARLRRDEVRVTRTGAVVGSPAYMSPEALHGDELDPRSDIWSFGVLLYEMLAGRRPFEGQQLTPVLVSILQDKVPPVTEFRPDTPPALVNLLQRMLEKNPERRPSSMRQVAAELEAIAWGRTADDGPQTVDGGSVQVGAPSLPSPISNLPPFVGREQTLSRLQALLRRATGGAGAVSFVLGEAGQGKTSLLQAFVQQSLQQFPSLLVAGGNCNAYTGSGDPYLPFREILETLAADSRAQATDRSSGVLEILLETGPDLLNTFIPARNVVERLPEKGQQVLAQAQLTSARRVTSALQQQDLFEQFARVMKALSRRRPLLLFLDDLQWVDQGSANLLLHLGRGIETHAIMILGAYRPAEVSVGRDGGRHPLETPLFELQRVFGDMLFDLSEEEGRPFINALIDSEPNRLDEAFREMLYRQTGGHPLFTLELLRSMQERGDLVVDKDGNWVAQLDLDWHTLPARVEGAIGERISRLPAELKEVLEVASVEGEEFATETVARALGTDERLTMRQISGVLDRKHLLVRALDVRQVGSVRLSRYRFRHILIQRYLYNSMDAVEKVYQHEAVARALEALYGDETATIAAHLARHLDLAQLPAEAAVYFEQAGDQARRAVALEEAARYFEAALARWPPTDTAGRAALLRRLGECQWIRGELQDALATYEECFNLFEAVDDMHGAGAVQRSMGRLYWEIADRERSLEHYHHSLEILERIPESVELAWTISSLSQMYMLASQYDEAIEWGEWALALAEQLDVDDVKTHALNNVGVAYMETGQLQLGKKLVRESLHLALELGLPHDACRAYLNLGEVPAGAYEERRAVLQELADYATSIRAPLYAGSAHTELGNIEWELGEWRAAQARRAEIAAWIERAPTMGYLRGVNSVFLGRMYNDLGQFDKALDALEPVLPLVRSQNEVQIIGPHMGQLARALAAKNREREAVDILHEMLEAIMAQPYVHRDSTPALLFACTWFAEHRPTKDALEMAAQFRDLLEVADEHGTKPDVAAAWREAAGAVLAASGLAVDAVPHFQSAVEQWRELGRLFDETRAAIALGRALDEIGDKAGMQVAHTRAAALLQELASQLDGEEDRENFLNSFPDVKRGQEHWRGLPGRTRTGRAGSRNRR